MSDITYTLKELQEKLTEKERIFCHEYIIDWNGARAARKAGYSEKNARTIATQNLAKLHIEQYIDFIKNDIAKEAGITKLRIVNELTKIAFSNITDIFEITEGKLTLKDPEKKLSDYSEELTDVISELQETRDGIKVKMYCKDAGLINLLKAMGWNEPDKIKQETINYNASVTKEEAKDISEALENEC